MPVPPRWVLVMLLVSFAILLLLNLLERRMHLRT